jgi:hypothetical protein
MRRVALDHKRDLALVWGLISVICLGGVLLVWLRSPTAAGHALFGPGGSRAVAAVALLVTAAGTVAALSFSGSSGRLRWGVALPVALASGAVAALGLGSFLDPGNGTDVSLGLLLLLGAAGTGVVAIQVSRDTLP